MLLFSFRDIILKDHEGIFFTLLATEDIPLQRSQTPVRATLRPQQFPNPKHYLFFDCGIKAFLILGHGEFLGPYPQLTKCPLQIF